MKTLAVIANPNQDLDALTAYLEAHPLITSSAPRWARGIEFASVDPDGSSKFTYWFNDDRFEVEENWEYTPARGVTYGTQTYMNDEPGITSYDDALLELVTEYIERTHP